MGRLTKVAVYGGAFDPITRGHAFFARVLAKCPDLVDEVWIMPAAKHRFGKQMAPAEDRLAMCRLVFPDHPKIKICDYEIKRQSDLKDGSTYTTMLWMNKSFPDCHFHIAIGTDNANIMHTWARWEELTDDFPFIIVPRGGVPLDQTVKWYRDDRHKVLKLEKTMSTSSTDARDIVQKVNAESTMGVVSSETAAKVESVFNMDVYEYIMKQRLYGAQSCQESAVLAANG